MAAVNVQKINGFSPTAYTTARVGDLAITNNNIFWILVSEGATVAANWKRLDTDSSDDSDFVYSTATGITGVELFVDGISNNRITIANNTIVSFATSMIIYDTINNVECYNTNINGVIKNINNTVSFGQGELSPILSYGTIFGPDSITTNLAYNINANDTLKTLDFKFDVNGYPNNLKWKSQTLLNTINL